MNLLNFLYGAAALGFSALVPLYAEQRFGIASLEAGTLLTARAVGMISTAALAALLLRRTGNRWPMVIGYVIVIATGCWGSRPGRRAGFRHTCGWRRRPR